MNNSKLEFTVDDGDLKAGSGPCPDSLYSKALGWVKGQGQHGSWPPFRRYPLRPKAPIV